MKPQFASCNIFLQVKSVVSVDLNLSSPSV